MSVLFLATTGALQAAPKPAPALQDLLKNNVIASQTRLGALEPWQKRIFDDEIVPQYQRFIRDYKPSSEGVTVEVDMDGMKKYIAFFAPKALGVDKPSLAVVVEGAQGCAKCIEGLSAYKRIARARLERRGFSVVDEKTPARLRGSPVGELQLRSREMAPEELDSAHAGERHFEVTLKFKVEAAGFGGFKRDDRSELMEEDGVENAAARLLTDALVELGARVLAASASNAGGARDGLLLTLVGFKNNEQYEKARTKIADLAGGTVVERTMARGQAVLALRGARASKDLRSALANVQLGFGTMSVTESDDETMRVEIK